MFDAVGNINESLEQLARDFQPRELSGEQALRLVRELGVMRALVDGLVAKAAKRVDETQVFVQLGDRNAAQTLARAMGVGVGEARRAIETAELLVDLPATDAAVRAGKLSLREAELIAGAASRNPGAESSLLDVAGDGLVPLKDACVQARTVAEDPVERPRRQHASRAVRSWTDDDGMSAGSWRLPPEIGGQITAILEAGVQKLFRQRRSGHQEPHEAYAADVFVEAFLGTQSQAKGVKTNVHIVIDYTAIERGCLLAGERCEIPGVGPVNVEWVRGLLGEAFVTAVIKRGVDITTVAHLGRHIPAELRTALIVGGRECSAPGCHNRGYLERDHIEDFAKGGSTAWWNLQWLCYIHHKRKTANPRLARAG